MASAGPTHQLKQNELASETSPYLLQHAHNPVDWMPWGAKAFKLAREQDKPIFLSIGYSTCHWCHVMERESFESEDVAALMNAGFVNIKVDREERPDVDRIYMAYVQGITGSGGWPMSVFLTPELEPLYGGTYFPPNDMNLGGGRVRPGFKTVLKRIAQLWDTDKVDLRDRAGSVMSQLRELHSPSSAPAASGASGGTSATQAAEVVRLCVDQLGRRFDKELGGFGGSPKFPRPSEVNLLLRAHLLLQASGDDPQTAEYARHMALMTLTSMAAGGVHDHVGGGFARYSVDEFWHVPHFEKMLYDQTQLAIAYTNAYQLTGDVQFAKVVRSTLDYLRRDMTAPGGGIYSAEDADSLDEATGTKLEGAFYLWTAADIQTVLGQEKAAIFGRAYYVREEGNCDLSERSDPHGEFGGKNCLIQRRPLADVATEFKLSAAQLDEVLAECKQRLHSVRSQRPRPSLDDKVVAMWNGLAISAFAVASRALAAEPALCPALFPVDGVPPRAYLDAACRIAAFVRKEMYDEEQGTLKRAYCRGASGVMGFADDYAAMIGGLLDLYECGGGLQWLRWALRLQDTLDKLFWDQERGGYYSTCGTDESIILRMKDDYDGAEPTASSLAAVNLFRLAALVPGSGRSSSSSSGSASPPPAAGDAEGNEEKDRVASTSASPSSSGLPDYHHRADRTLLAFGERLSEAPLAVPQMCCASYLQARWPLRQVIVAGKLESDDTQRLLDAVHSGFTPDKVVVVIDPHDKAEMDFWRTHSPEAHAMVERHFASMSAATATASPAATATASPTDAADPSSAPAAAAHGAAAATAFICQNFTCQAPTSEPDRVRMLLMAGSDTKAPRVTTLPGFKL